MTSPAGPTHLGFLALLADGGGTLGGYLVTNFWGRPLEFRLSTAVNPNKVQQILYGPTLKTYVSADLIGKTLYDKTPTPVQVVFTDSADALDLRRSIEVPVALVTNFPGAGGVVRAAAAGRPAVVAHPDFPADVPALKDLFERLGPSLDVAEPFARIRDAVGEARKLGVTQRAAG